MRKACKIYKSCKVFTAQNNILTLTKCSIVLIIYYFFKSFSSGGGGGGDCAGIFDHFEATHLNGSSADWKPAGPAGSQDSQRLTDFKKRVLMSFN